MARTGEQVEASTSGQAEDGKARQRNGRIASMLSGSLSGSLIGATLQVRMRADALFGWLATPIAPVATAEAFCLKAMIPDLAMI